MTKRKNSKIPVIALLVATLSVDVSAQHYNDATAGRNVSGVAQEFNAPKLDSIEAIEANRLVNGFDAIAGSHGTVHLLDTSGKVDIEIKVNSKSDTLAEMDDGRFKKSFDTYKGTVNGQPAMLVRWDDRLSISWIVNGSEQRMLREFVKDSPERTRIPEKIRKINPLNYAKSGSDILVDSPIAGSQAAVSKRKKRMASDSPTSNEIIAVHVFVHQDTGATDFGSIHAGYFAWWSDHMAKDILPGVRVRVRFIFNEDGINNMAYRNLEGGREAALKNFGERVVEYRNKNSIFGSGITNKFLLFTEYSLDSTTLGIAKFGQDFAIASNDDYNVGAHELGHLMGAIHDDGVVNYNGWWCDTIMSWPVPFRSSCYTYSEASKQRIREYFRNHAGFQLPG
ncbi:hypothetical protein ACPUER_36240 [Burkholderia sp. DN3021]|uniref:hypothetical protein n=1 Tax=Burkholderia sp. DN3021 TaxID=3410137 RepID=UPI003C7DCDF1